MDRQTALVTGASSGIGAELAAILAREGFNVVLVARGEKALQERADEFTSRYGVDVKVMAQDLALPGAPDELYRALEQAGIAVDVLVNSAGFATYGYFHEIDLKTELDMMQVNMAALTHLTKLLLPGMLARGRGRILNVASTAAFQPGPLMAVYYATKAYVLSLSEALAEEYADKGIVVSALCPGPTRTGFQKRAAMEQARLVQRGLMDARAVAESGYRGLMKGQRVIVPGMLNRLGALMTRFAPRRMATRLVMTMHHRVGH